MSTRHLRNREGGGAWLGDDVQFDIHGRHEIHCSNPDTLSYAAGGYGDLFRICSGKSNEFFYAFERLVCSSRCEDIEIHPVKRSQVSEVMMVVRQ